MSLTIQIGPDDDAAYKFVYHLGAPNLDNLLSAQTDEAIRGLVYSVPYKKVKFTKIQINTFKVCTHILYYYCTIDSRYYRTLSTGLDSS